MTEPEVYEKLQVIFSGLFPHTSVTLSPGLTAKAVVGWDSMKQVELLMEAEEAFEIEFKPAEVEQLGSIGDLVQVILKHLNG